MPSFSRNDVILVRYPFSDLTASKVRPAIVVSNPHASGDYLIVPVTSRTTSLSSGEFILANWASAGLNVPSAAKRGIYTVNSALILRLIGHISQRDTTQLDSALNEWLGLP
jgi:mRNA interferase MazF